MELQQQLKTVVPHVEMLTTQNTQLETHRLDLTRRVQDLEQVIRLQHQTLIQVDQILRERLGVSLDLPDLEAVLADSVIDDRKPQGSDASMAESETEKIQVRVILPEV